MKTLIRCPHCQAEGKTQTLGAVMPDGYIVVQRTSNNNVYRDFTIIQGSEFTLICGKCGHSVYIRKEADEGSYIGAIGVFRFILKQGTLSQEIPNYTSEPGTFVQSQGSNGVFQAGTA